MSKKRSNADMEVDSSESDGDVSDERMTEIDVYSPSPETKTKDMHLRNGKRKRRRSKDTTGLTPPEQVLKKLN